MSSVPVPMCLKPQPEGVIPLGWLLYRRTVEESNALLEYCRARKWHVYRWYGDAVLTRGRRPQLTAMLAACAIPGVEGVACYRLDQLARSLSQLVRVLSSFSQAGLQFVSIAEQIDTTQPGGPLLYRVMDALARFERELQRGRVRTGMRHAGKRLGPPCKYAHLQGQVREMRHAGLSFSEIALRLRMSRETARRLWERRGATAGVSS